MSVTKLLDPVTGGPPLPSQAVLALAGMALLCIALLTALVLATSEQATATAYGPQPERAGEPSTALLGAEPPLAPAAGTAAGTTDTPEATPVAAPAAKGGREVVALDSLLAAFPAEPQTVPTATITAVEEAGGEALEVEMGRLLDAIQVGFGSRSAQLEPSLRPYVFRIAGRLSVRSELFRIAVTAPDASLARARAATLRRLFDVAGVTGSRLAIGAGAGPHALSLVTE